MRICFIAQDINFTGKYGFINGGTVTLWHYWHTAQSMGHAAVLIEVGQPIPEADLYILQSEWYEVSKEELEKKNGKVAVWLGHFIGTNYYDPKKIKADAFFTTWTGELLDEFALEQDMKIMHLPHAFCEVCDYQESVKKDLIWLGNTYALRNEGWLEGLPVEVLKGLDPRLITAYYRGATVTANLHGEFQKGVVSEEPSRIADKPGYAVNERLFHVAGVGFQVCDYNPLIEIYYPNGEIVMAKTKEEYQELIRHFLENPEQRNTYMERARETTLNSNTYSRRLNMLLEKVCGN